MINITAFVRDGIEYIQLSNISIVVPNEGYCRNASWALSLISTVLCRIRLHVYDTCKYKMIWYCYYDYLRMPQYSWNIAKVGVKHQSINQSINQNIRWSYEEMLFNQL